MSTCPHCQRYIESSVAKLRKERKRLGRCLKCGKTLEGPDTRYVRCHACRVYEAAIQKRLRN